MHSRVQSAEERAACTVGLAQARHDTNLRLVAPLHHAPASNMQCHVHKVLFISFCSPAFSCGSTGCRHEAADQRSGVACKQCTSLRFDTTVPENDWATLACLAWCNAEPLRCSQCCAHCALEGKKQHACHERTQRRLNGAYCVPIIKPDQQKKEKRWAGRTCIISPESGPTQCMPTTRSVVASTMIL